jgi:anthranilate/para-aminobenzoate synthase component I
MAAAPIAELRGEAAGADPFGAWERFVAPSGPHDEACALPEDLPAPLCMGYFAYEAGALADRIPLAPLDRLGLPVLWWARYPAALVGRPDGEAWVVGDSEASVDALLGQLRRASTRHPSAPRAMGPARADRSDDAYRRGVERVLESIGAGEIYQANIALRFAARLEDGADPLGLFLALREATPAHYAAFGDFGSFQVLSASPECLVEWDGRGGASSWPIKGTRPRGGAPTEDAALARQLQRDPKERAEHVMIVDLVRNDLGRVARPGSVSVPELFGVRTFRGLHHLVSEVRAELRPGVGTGELIRALFPGGSITGAPKVRATEVIAEIEGARRGVYCGSIGYTCARTGRGALNIAIRTGIVQAGALTYHVGGGIVADSDPDRELAEARLKALGWAQIL